MDSCVQELSAEDELQTTVERLRHTQHVHEARERELIAARTLLAQVRDELEASRGCMHLCVQNVVRLQDELHEARCEQQHLTRQLARNRDRAVESEPAEVEDFASRPPTPQMSHGILQEKDCIEEENAVIENANQTEEDMADEAINQETSVLEEEVKDLREEVARASLFQERLTDTLTLIRGLLHLEVSPQALGELVSEALECSVDPSTSEVNLQRFLNLLHHGASEWERLNTQRLIRLALQAL